MHVSFAEMARNAPEVLRMLGVSYSQADDAVEGFLLTHAALDVGYELLSLTDRSDKDSWRQPVISAQGETTHVDLGSQSLLLFATRLVDLAVSSTQAASTNRVVVDNAIGGWMAAYMAYRVAVLGCHASVSWIPADGGSEDAPLHTVSAAPAPSGKDEDICCHIVDGTLPDGVSAGSRGKLIIDVRGAEFQDGGFRSGGRELRFIEAYRAFVAEGKEIDPAVHSKNFAAIQWRMRVAPSERSRGQAG